MRTHGSVYVTGVPKAHVSGVYAVPLPVSPLPQVVIVQEDWGGMSELCDRPRSTAGTYIIGLDLHSAVT